MSESDFELELRDLKPAPTSPALETAIARELAREQRAVVVQPTAGLIVRERPAVAFRWWQGLGWAFAGAVATFAVVSYLPARHSVERSGVAAQPVATAAPEAYFEPVASAREVLASTESEISYDAEDGPTQVVRYASVERHRWENPVTGALVEVEVPREDILVVAVTYQ